MREDSSWSRKQIIGARDYLEKILQSMNDSLVVISPEGIIQAVNPATCVLLGYTQDELLNQSYTKIIKAGEFSFLTSWLHSLVTGRYIRNVEEIYLAKDGREIPVLFSGSLMLDDVGEVLGIVCAAQDITERKLAEESLRRAKDQLEVKVAERTAQLRQTNEQLELELSERKRAEEALTQAYSDLKNTQQELVQTEKLAALGRFSLGIAHEVKNPLAIILGGLEFLEAKLALKEPHALEAIVKIKDAIFRADSIVGGLLKFARPSELKTEKVRPVDLISEALALLQYRAPLVNITIHTEFSDEEMHIDVDRNQMQQVIFNLVNNAIEAMPGGGKVLVKAYRAQPQYCLRDMPCCALEVIDTGEGIPRVYQGKLFEPFFTTKRERRGTGLGLSIARTIVNNHGGDILIESEVGRGTSVKVILPLAKSAGGHAHA